MSVELPGPCGKSPPSFVCPAHGQLQPLEGAANEAVAVPLRLCAVGVSLPPHREVETLAGVPSLLVSLGHTGRRRVILGVATELRVEEGDPKKRTMGRMGSQPRAGDQGYGE